MKFNLFCTNIFIYICIAFFSSCAKTQDIVYLNKNSESLNRSQISYVTKFKPDDLLEININSENVEATKPFNLSSVAFDNNNLSAVGQPIQQLYLIDNNGQIDFPILGKLNIAGKTRMQVLDLFHKKLSPKFIKDPQINIRITNFNVTVLGDVMRPGRFNIPNERINIFEALGLAGDMNITGRRDDVKVIRENNGNKKVFNLNLLDANIFNSDAYYLEQNDIIYVQQNKTRVQESKFNRNTGLIISVGSILISLLTILSR